MTSPMPTSAFCHRAGGRLSADALPAFECENLDAGKLKDFSQVGVKVIDDLTLQLTLSGTAPYFPGMLKHYSWFRCTACAGEVRGTNSARSPGPSWAITSATTAISLEVLASPRAVGPTAILGCCDGEAERDSLLPHRVGCDGGAGVSGRPVACHAGGASDRIPRRTRPDIYHEDPHLACYFYRVNTTKPPFSDPRVRKALALAIDRESVQTRNVLKAGQKPAVGLTCLLAVARATRNPRRGQVRSCWSPSSAG